MEKGKSANEDADPGEGGWKSFLSRRVLKSSNLQIRTLEPKRVNLAGSHVDWRKERVPTRTLTLKRVDGNFSLTYAF